MRFRPMLIVKETNDKSMMTYLTDVGTPIELGVYTWLIEGAPENVLVDTGCSAEYLNSIGFPSEQITTQEEALDAVGLTVGDIDRVILTHLHSDHAKDFAKYPNAIFVVQRWELEFAEDPHPIQAGWFVDIATDRLQVVDGDQEILEGIQVIHTPGHTPGGQSVLIETEEGAFCLSGLCTIRDNFYPPQHLQDVGIRAIAPGIHTNAMQAYDSIIKTLEASDQVIALHDMASASMETIP